MGRTSHFLSRIDRHLQGMTSVDEQSAFLTRQTRAWEERYARFVVTAGASEPVTDPNDPPQAADFTVTITALAARRSVIAA